MIEVKRIRHEDADAVAPDPYARKSAAPLSKVPGALGLGLTALAIYLKSFLGPSAAAEAEKPDPAKTEDDAQQLGVRKLAGPENSGASAEMPPEPGPREVDAASGPSMVFTPDPGWSEAANRDLPPLASWSPGFLARPEEAPLATLASAAAGVSGPQSAARFGGYSVGARSSARDDLPSPEAGTPDLDGETPDEAGKPVPPKRGEDTAGRNRAPRHQGPVQLDDLGSAVAVTILLGQLLSRTEDPDGDQLAVRNLTASSGSLEAIEGGWIFRADAGDPGPVTFHYEVWDGVVAVAQVAKANLVAKVQGGTKGDALPAGKAEKSAPDGLDGDDGIAGAAKAARASGTAGDDRIVGGEGDDVLHGLDGADLIFGGAGNDWISGGQGDDSIEAGGGDDLAHGDGGDDTVKGQAGKDRLYGGTGDDLLDGGADQDQLFGEDGADDLAGAEGDDLLDGGAGDDQLLGQEGEDRLIGAAGDDLLDGGADQDSLFGQDGVDDLAGGEGNDLLDGGLGDDLLDGGAGQDHLLGQEGEDRLAGAAGNDLLDGGSGSDVLAGGADDDQLRGGEGDDGLAGEAGDDLLLGDTGDDALDGGDGEDTVLGGEGDDLVAASADGADDLLDGGDGTDHLDYSDSQIEVVIDLILETVTDSLGGTDSFEDFETFTGSAHDDTIVAHTLTDGELVTLTGGDGDDLFSFLSSGLMEAPVALYQILDFASGDRVKVMDYEFRRESREAMRDLEQTVDDFFTEMTDRIGGELDPRIRFTHEWTDEYQRTLLDVDFDRDGSFDLNVILDGQHDFVLVTSPTT